MSNHACTLYEGSYHVGAGALFNSLYANGFRGIFWIGYRGDLPAWANSGAQKDGDFEFAAAEGAVIRFVQMDGPRHLANCKALFMKSLLDNYYGDDDCLFYFDPDITIKVDWPFFENWASFGIALVEDCTVPYLPADHPIRSRWMEVAKTIGYSKKRELSRYYNSGFIGVQARYKEALVAWNEVLKVSENYGYRLSGFKAEGPMSLWRAADQDHLNLMLMTTDLPLSTMGPESMDFRPGGYVMSHAVDSPKPWSKRFVRYALKGISPTSAEKRFWENVAYPIAVYPSATIQQRQLALRISSAIGRFIHHAS